MFRNSKLTPVEWEIMEAIWKQGGAPSVRQIVDRIYPNGEKAYTTVQTIMKTLEKKGYLKSEKIGLVNFYTPTTSRDEMVKVEMSSLVSRVFHGSSRALANYLLTSEELSLKEIEEIKNLVKKREMELKKRGHQK